jgi:hypothetical protein
LAETTSGIQALEELQKNITGLKDIDITKPLKAGADAAEKYQSSIDKMAKSTNYAEMNTSDLEDQLSSTYKQFYRGHAQILSGKGTPTVTDRIGERVREMEQ